jgi:hypothetical protein
VRILNLKLVGWLTMLALLWLRKLGKEESMRVTPLDIFQSKLERCKHMLMA